MDDIESEEASGEDLLDPEFDHTYGQVSGRSDEDCWHLGYRFPKEQGFSHDAGDSWLLRSETGVLHTVIKKAGWLTSVWCSPTGAVFVTDADGFVYRGPVASDAPWPVQKLDGVLTGVFGLDDQHVYVWGELAGRESDEEAYACGHSGDVLTGSVFGWTLALSHPDPVASIRAWNGEVWVGAYGDQGLCKLNGNALVSIKPNLKISYMESHDVLLFSTLGMVGPTADGANFVASFVDVFAGMTQNEPPLWI